MSEDQLRQLLNSNVEYQALIEAALKLEDVEPYLTGELLEDVQRLGYHLRARIGMVARRVEREIKSKP